MESGALAGCVVWFTGFSGSGKTTTAAALEHRLLESGRKVVSLDGDAVRASVTRDLGFSRSDRIEQTRRVGARAVEVAEAGGVAIVALISPYRSAREAVREMTRPGTFVEVFVNTPLAVCEQRDPKGLYRAFRQGQIRNLTGLDDPYEPPLSPELAIDTLQSSPDANVQRIVLYLSQRRLL